MQLLTCWRKHEIHSNTWICRATCMRFHYNLFRNWSKWNYAADGKWNHHLIHHHGRHRDHSPFKDSSLWSTPHSDLPTSSPNLSLRTNSIQCFLISHGLMDLTGASFARFFLCPSTPVPFGITGPSRMLGLSSCCWKITASKLQGPSTFWWSQQNSSPNPSSLECLLSFLCARSMAADSPPGR